MIQITELFEIYALNINIIIITNKMDESKTQQFHKLIFNI